MRPKTKDTQITNLVTNVRTKTKNKAECGNTVQISRSQISSAESADQTGLKAATSLLANINL